MVYRYACPSPCRRVVTVHADTDEEAIERLIGAGAMGCRNLAYRNECREGHHHMPLLSEVQLRQIILWGMEAEASVPFTVAPQACTREQRAF